MCTVTRQVQHPGVASDREEHSLVGRKGHGDADADVGDDDDDGDHDDDHVDDDADDEVEACLAECRAAPCRISLRRPPLRNAARVRCAAEAAARPRTLRRPLAPAARCPACGVFPAFMLLSYCIAGCQPLVWESAVSCTK